MLVVRLHGRLQEREVDNLYHETDVTNSETVLLAVNVDTNVTHQEGDAIFLHAQIHLTQIEVETTTR